MVKWEEILKVQVLGNKQKVKMGNIPIPTEDDNSCLKRLEVWLAKLNTLRNKYPTTYDSSISENGLLLMTEESACSLLKQLNEVAVEYLAYDRPPHIALYDRVPLRNRNKAKLMMSYNTRSEIINFNLMIRWLFVDVNPGTIDDGVEFPGVLRIGWTGEGFNLFTLNSITEEVMKICKEA